MGSQERVTLYYLIRSYSTISLLFTRINITNTCTCMLILSIFSGFHRPIISLELSSLCQVDRQVQFPTGNMTDLPVPILGLNSLWVIQNPDFSFQSE